MCFKTEWLEVSEVSSNKFFKHVVQSQSDSLESR
jgi:hypothetical protein